MSMNNPRCMIIAEAGNNHEGRLDVALELVERAKESGADLVKFQAGTAEGFARNPIDPAEIAKYRKYELGVEGYNLILKHGLKVGIPVFFSVWPPFDPEMAAYHKLAYRKVPARQCNHDVISKLDSPTTFISIPHSMTLKAAAMLPIAKGIPMHVVAEYPAASAMLTRMADLRAALKRRIGEVGYSDHTVGIYWPVRVATDAHLRARAIEKHFTLKHDFGPLRDHALSATPAEMKEMVERIKT